MAIEPVTREERFLAAAGGQNVTTPTPITRKEQLLQGIIDAVKSGGATPEVIENAVNNYLAANPVKPGATEEQAAQIEQNKNDIESLQTEIENKQPKGDYVKTVNGNKPDASGNVVVATGGNGSGENPSQGGLTTAQINALDGMFKVCAFVQEDVSAQYNAFREAFGLDSGGDTDKTLTSITATYSGGSVPVGTTVSALTGIVVTAHYSDGSSAAVTGYNLTGEIAEGENTVTVSYGGKTTTIIVVGVAEETGAAQYAYTIVGTGRVNDQGAVEPMPQYDLTDFIDVDANYAEVTFATYVDEASDTAMTSFSYAQWFNGDKFISRTGGGPTIVAGSLKGTKTHTMPEGATKFRVSVQNNCSRFALFKGTVTADEV